MSKTFDSSSSDHPSRSGAVKSRGKRSRNRSNLRERAAQKLARAKIVQLLGRLDHSLLERKSHVRLAMLALLTGHHTLLLGPPGTAKSLLARALCQCIREAEYFEYLLSKFTHPDELFGPVSIPGLKQEDYRRLTDGYLPRAHLGFLDEIFKANSAILNGLLTLINERIFHHGKHRDAVPLLGVIGASNEPPDPEGGLGALYDRFLVRLAVPPIQDDERFLQVCLGELEPLEIHDDQRLTLEEIAVLRGRIGDVQASQSIRRTLVGIRKRLLEHDIDASDRRWRWALDLVKMSAVTSGRQALSPLDLALLEYCFGDPGRDEAVVRKAVRDHLMLSVDERRYLDPMQVVWDDMSRPNDFMDKYEYARARRIEQLDLFDRSWKDASHALDVQLQHIRAQAGECPWLLEIPAELLAGFVNARRTMEQFSRKSDTYRKLLVGERPLARLANALRRQKREHRYHHWGCHDEGAAVWLCERGEEQDSTHWIPIDSNGASLFAMRERCFEFLRSRMSNAFGYYQKPEFAGQLHWTHCARCVELDDDWLHTLHRPQKRESAIRAIVKQSERHRQDRQQQLVREGHPVFAKLTPSLEESENAFHRLIERVVESGEYSIPKLPTLLDEPDLQGSS